MSTRFIHFLFVFFVRWQWISVMCTEMIPIKTNCGAISHGSFHHLIRPHIGYTPKWYVSDANRNRKSRNSLGHCSTKVIRVSIFNPIGFHVVIERIEQNLRLDDHLLQNDLVFNAQAHSHDYSLILIADEGIYNTYILDTDYKSWALIMHCAEKEKSTRYLSALLLSRERELGMNVISYLRWENISNDFVRMQLIGG